ncbi:MAG: Signal peptidase-like protein [Cytophagaceae bacterium]|nr:Signal peptidase-like protein [Cytophagaceae bacterium]MDW8456325.1 regulatory iron-sulfur-containing complex subunit RicT [Cytophagaceae bacterium]
MSCASCGTGSGCGTVDIITVKKTSAVKKSPCTSGGCGKLDSYDWLGVMEMSSQKEFDVVEVKFKNGRKDFFRNTNRLILHTGDAVVVDASGGHHIGYVSLQGELVRLQMRKKNVENNEDIKIIYRIANAKDLEKFEQAKAREDSALFRTREIIRNLKLDMKLNDVEFQADNTKATFYYSAEERVDFRELIKILAAEYKVRIEMKQISMRQEAGRLGGIGSCGRELCCSTWLTDFKNVNTSAARYQNLALNPSKLSGQCGRLKCCLNYELDTYMEALKDIPEVEQPLLTEKGPATLQKTDIFKKIMWFAYKDDESTWIPIHTDRVVAILEMNKQNKLPASLEFDVIESSEDKILQEKAELSRFDDKFKKKKKKKKRKKKNKGKTPDSTNS